MKSIFKNSVWGSLLLIISTSIFSAEILPVYGKGLEKLKSQEIGQFIKNFIPDSGDKKISWGYKANDSMIIWLHKPYKEEFYTDGTKEILRKGVFRSHVNGVKTTYLEDREYELPWQVVYRAESMAKFGVEIIQFNPNVPDIDIIESGNCFGVEFSNCEFDPLPSLKRVGIATKKICDDGRGSMANFERVYLLTMQGKQPIYAIHMMSTGSGGSSSNFRLILDTTKEKICKSVKW